MLEKDVKKALKKYLARIGSYQLWPVQMGYGAATVDCIFCHRGLFYGVECKAPGKRDSSTPRQRATLEEIMRHGAACVEDDPDLPNVRRMIATADTLSN